MVVDRAWGGLGVGVVGGLPLACRGVAAVVWGVGETAGALPLPLLCGGVVEAAGWEPCGFLLLPLVTGGSGVVLAVGVVAVSGGVTCVATSAYVRGGGWRCFWIL